MKATLNGVMFQEIKTVPNREKTAVFRFAELRDLESFTKLELFVSDKFDSPTPAAGTKVNAVVEIREQRKGNGVSLTLVSLRP